MGTKGISQYTEWIVVGNRFTSIVLNKGGINLDVSAILIGDEGGSRDAHGLFANNFVDNVTKVTFAGNAWYIVHGQSTSAFVATGNFIQSATTLTDYFSGNVHDSHNMIEQVGQAGDHNLDLSDLTDVTITSVGDDDLLAYDSGSAVWINQTAAEAGLAAASHTHVEADVTDLTHKTDVESLDDVTLTAIAAGELLKWNGTAWINNTLAEAGISAPGHTHTEAEITDLTHITQLSDLSDVNTSTPTNRNVLVADGIDFESRALVEADVSDLGAYIVDVSGSPLDELSDVTAHAHAKGTILVSNGTTWEVLTVGTDGQVLESLAAAATGLVWATDDTGASVAGINELMLIGA
jgi:hypothetical protein